MLVGMGKSAVKVFDEGYNYYKPLDIYVVDTKVFCSYFTKILYSLGPLAIIALLTFIECSKSRNAVLFLLVMISLFSSAYNGGIAYKKAKANREEANYFYDTTPILNQVDATKFAIYINDGNHVDRILWVYGLFFDKKYKRGSNYDSAIENEKDIQSNIKIFNDLNTLMAADFGDTILTDEVVKITSLFKKSRIVKIIPWKNKFLYAIKIAR